MTLRLYGGDAALCTVIELAGLVLETITLGYRSTKIAMMQNALVIVVAVNAHPS